MHYDMIISGVGGQGILSIASVIALAAMKSGLQVRQSEIHGMSQRGGSVSANVRISDGEVPSDLIAYGTADMILSMEPLESLRYLDFLSPQGILITAEEPVININNYPELNDIHQQILTLPKTKLIPAQKLARQAQSAKATNMVLVGAATHYLPLKKEKIQEAIQELFMRKGKNIMASNIKAFELGAQA